MSLPLIATALAIAGLVLAARAQKNRQPKKAKVPVPVITHKRNK
jgi:hypothetical protein